MQRLQRIVALKQQGFQLPHIHKLLEAEPEAEQATLMTQLQQTQPHSRASHPDAHPKWIERRAFPLLC